jgi:hypothetical protein
MKYYIIEIQKHENGNYAHLIDTANDMKNAESKAYTKLQYAAISNRPVHTVLIIDEEGHLYNSKCYKNDSAEE